MKSEERRGKRKEKMKRFFKVVEKDSDGSVKKPRENDSEAEESNEKKEPLKFMTWNANSFLLRVKNNWPDFTNLITTFDPDLIAIQVLSPFVYFLSLHTCGTYLEDHGILQIELVLILIEAK